MHQDIRKEELLKLCEALEKGTITLEQFNKLSDLEKTNEVSALIHIMETTGLENKDILFENIIKEDNIKPICAMLKEIFRKNIIYKTDIERQNFIFQVIVDNFNNALELSNLLSNDVIWNNKEFVDNIIFRLKLIPEEKYESLCKFNTVIKLLNLEIAKNIEIFNDETFISAIYHVLKSRKEDCIRDYLESIKIESVRKNQNFLEFLDKVYKEQSEHTLFGYEIAYKLEEFDKNNRLSVLLDKVEEIATSDLNGGQKHEKYMKLSRNVINITEEMIEKYSDDNLKYLIEQATIDDKFNETKELLDAVDKGDITLEEASKIKKYLEKISWHNVRSMALYVYLDDKNLLSEEDFQNFESCSYDKAKLIITRLSIEKGNDEYKNEGLSYFGEKFSKGFIEYLNSNNLTKEEILELRDKIVHLESKFVPHKKTFIIDTSSIVEEPELTEKEIEKEIEKENSKQMVKRRKEENRKWGNICAWLKR